jgi:hypothetical protein
VYSRFWSVGLKLLGMVERVVTDEWWLRLEPLTPVATTARSRPRRIAGSRAAGTVPRGRQRLPPAALERMNLTYPSPLDRGRLGRPRQRPRVVFTDRGYDHDKYRRLLRQCRITPKIGWR